MEGSRAQITCMVWPQSVRVMQGRECRSHVRRPASPRGGGWCSAPRGARACHPAAASGTPVRRCAPRTARPGLLPRTSPHHARRVSPKRALSPCRPARDPSGALVPPPRVRPAASDDRLGVVRRRRPSLPLRALIVSAATSAKGNLPLWGSAYQNAPLEPWPAIELWPATEAQNTGNMPPNMPHSRMTPTLPLRPSHPWPGVDKGRPGGQGGAGAQAACTRVPRA